MKKYLYKFAISMLLVPSVKAAPYFRLLDPAHPQLNAGTYVGVGKGGQTTGGVYLPLITHSQKDGYLLFKGEDWSLLGIGGSGNLNNFTLNIGPAFNLAPSIKSLLLAGLSAITAPGNYANLKSMLSPNPDAPSDVSISLGPTLSLSPQQNWKGSYATFLGAAFKF